MPAMSKVAVIAIWLSSVLASQSWAQATARDPLPPASLVMPPEPTWSAYQVTSRDYLAAKRAKKPVLEYLFGTRAQAIVRFNRLDPKFVWPGRRLKVPALDSDQADYQPMPARYPSADNQAKLALIDLSRQFIGLYERGQLVASYPISSGKSGHRTPAGSFQVSLKRRHHRSSIYPEPHGGWPMPYAVRFHKTLFWIHQGDLPGRPASHGCVRLMQKDAAAFFAWAEIGVPVVIVRRLQ